MKDSFSNYASILSDGTSLEEAFEQGRAEDVWLSLRGVLAETPISDLELVGEKLLEAGFVSQALSVFQHVRRRDSGLLWAAKGVCRAAAALQNHPFRARVAGEALKTWPDSVAFAAELAEACLLSGNTQDAILAASVVLRKDPSLSSFWIILARARGMNGQWDESQRCWQKVSELSPTNLHALFMQCMCFLRAELWQKAQALFDSRQEELRTHPHFETLKSQLKILAYKETNNEILEETDGPNRSVEKLKRQARYFSKRSMFKESQYCWEKLIALEPQNIRYQISRVKTLRCAGKHEEARAELDRLYAEEPQQRSLLISEKVKLEEDLGNYAISREILARAQEISFNRSFFSALCKSYRSLGRARELLPIFQKHLESSTISDEQRTHLEVKRSEIHISLGMKERAMDFLKRFEQQAGVAQFQERYPQHAAWYEYQRGNVAEAKRCLHAWIEKDPPRTCLKSPPLKKLKSAKREKVRAHKVLLFSAIRNEIERIPSFISHYRELGVDIFFIVDNGSSDGTKEYLLEQPDVSLFETSESYGHSGFGITWVHDLIDRYGENQWCIHVDADEFLVTPYSDTLGLDPLLRYMDKQGHEAFQAFMLDMFPESVSECKKWDAEGSPVSVSPYFDQSHHFIPCLHAPYVEVYGGARARIMGDGEGPGTNLTKTPIIKGGRGLRFLASTHQVSPAVISDVSGCLLHFKYLGDVTSYFSEIIERKEHHATCVVYHRYNEWFSKKGELEDLRCEDTRRFESSSQLVDLGLMRVTPNFEHFVRKKADPSEFEKEKIFILGLSRTGSHSIDKALSILGYDTAHWYRRTKREVLGGLESFFEADAFSDISVSCRFESLYHLFPNAKFIYLWREPEEWSVSVRMHYLRVHGIELPSDLPKLIAEGHGEQESWRHRVNSDEYIEAHFSLYAHHQTWLDAFECFDRRVHSFFERNDRARLLNLSVCSEESDCSKWTTLCEFLSKELPRESKFPHVGNTGVGRTFRQRREEL